MVRDEREGEGARGGAGDDARDGGVAPAGGGAATSRAQSDDLREIGTSAARVHGVARGSGGGARGKDGEGEAGAGAGVGTRGVVSRLRAPTRAAFETWRERCAPEAARNGREWCFTIGTRGRRR